MISRPTRQLAVALFLHALQVFFCARIDPDQIAHFHERRAMDFGAGLQFDRLGDVGGRVAADGRLAELDP